MHFKSETDLYNMIWPDKCTVSHVTTRFSDPRDCDLFCLTHALVRQTELQEFFMDYRITFQEETEGIAVFHNGVNVNWDYYREPNRCSVVQFSAARAKNRFAKQGQFRDNCINGFLFGEQAWCDYNVETLTWCPEILQDLSNVLGIPDMVKDWIKRSKPYLVHFYWEFDDIIFDMSNVGPGHEKVAHTYQRIIHYLSAKQHDQWNPKSDNAIVRLPDNVSVPKSNMIGCHEISQTRFRD